MRFLVILLMVLSTTMYSQHTYDSTTLYVDVFTTAGVFTMGVQDATVTPGITGQIGARIRDRSTELFFELAGGYNSQYSPSERAKEFYTNVDLNVGVFITKVFAIKLGGFYLSENSNRNNTAFGVTMNSQLDIPITGNLRFLATAGIGGNLSDNPMLTTLIRGSVGVSYELMQRNY